MDKRIASEYRDSDGYWIELADGWQNGNDPGTHGIVEETKGAAYQTLKMARPCECEDCKIRLAAKAKHGWRRESAK